ncbi:hypothetical protein [Clostridium sp. HV4-5-A1G]|uniref:hypothetical protein n=1 Tax=Clostridium sp. HV4-5-A1G TaxID=2004595 RepID=UPI00123B061B|nr:hypothetical protein [Clostridium sp. HV4-5-A1G]KAA8667706.1 hypothetical protein F3O63_15500 [Clostridium sp. HV4-5-A1G]
MKINKKGSKGSAPGFILMGMFFIIFFIDCYLVMSHYAHIRDERYVISSRIEDSYKQPVNTYQNDFEQFCATRDFINSSYEPSEVYIISPVGSAFNIDYIAGSSKTPLNSSPMDVKDTIAILDEKVQDDVQMEKIKNYLNSNPENVLVFYKFKSSSVNIKKSFNIHK